MTQPDDSQLVSSDKEFTEGETTNGDAEQCSCPTSEKQAEEPCQDNKVSSECDKSLCKKSYSQLKKKNSRKKKEKHANLQDHKPAEIQTV